MNYGDMLENEQEALKPLVDCFGDIVREQLAARGLRDIDSPIFRPCAIGVFRDAEKVVVAFAPAGGGMSSMVWIDRFDKVYAPTAFIDLLTDQFDWKLISTVVLPRPDRFSTFTVEQAVERHVGEVERTVKFRQLGNTDNVRHLDRYLTSFLSDHPNPERNVFVMMRFTGTAT
ncbi:hypothetical protein BJF84_17135 [Rhodococcus sp. CUA-806]|nr:hypothetical protein BJF84_17135 [Rhodococcus sp. CUA-806]